MPLSWTEPSPPKAGVSHYTHVIAETPVGQIILEWKGWKDGDPVFGVMPWRGDSLKNSVCSNDLDVAKALAQEIFDNLVFEMMKLTAISALQPPQEGE